MVPLYLVFWLITPLAKTATEKLEMRGESVTVENIGKTVTDGFEKVGNQLNQMASSESSRSFLQKTADLFVQVVGYILKFALILFGIVFFPVLAILLVVMVIIGWRSRLLIPFESIWNQLGLWGIYRMDYHWLHQHDIPYRHSCVLYRTHVEQFILQDQTFV